MSRLDTPRTFEKYDPKTESTATRTAHSAAEVVRLEFDGWREVRSASKQSRAATTEPAPAEQSKPASKPATQHKP